MKKLNIVVVTLILFILGLNQTLGQKTETLINPDSDIKFVWGTEFKTGSIKEHLGTAHGFFGGALINHSTLLGLSFGINLTHPKLNHGYIGLLVQHTHLPNNLVHFSGQCLLAVASAKGYNQEKTNLFDNLGNITGSSFYIIEPGLNVELNITGYTRLIFGISYRYTTGLEDLSFEQWDKTHEHSSQYSYNNNDLSGLQFNIGLKFGEF